VEELRKNIEVQVYIYRRTRLPLDEAALSMRRLEARYGAHARLLREACGVRVFIRDVMG